MLDKDHLHEIWEVHQDLETPPFGPLANAIVELMTTQHLSPCKAVPAKLTPKIRLLLSLFGDETNHPSARERCDTDYFVCNDCKETKGH
jgi:hypothetical protein